MVSINEMEKVSMTDLKDFTLCKAIPWIKRKLNWREPPTVSQQLGKKVNLREVTKNLPDPKYYEVYLRDKKTGLSGVIDVIAGDSAVEVKAFQRRYYNHFRIQLLGYAYLAEKNGFRIREAILIMEQKVKLKIEVTNDHIKYIENMVNDLVKILEDDSPPVVNPSKALCKACQYRKVCPVSSVVA